MKKRMDNNTFCEHFFPTLLFRPVGVTEKLNSQVNTESSRQLSVLLFLLFAQKG